MAPVTFVALGKKGAGCGMGAGRHDVERILQTFAEALEATGNRMGAGLNPEDGAGGGHGGEQARLGSWVELVADMAEDQQGTVGRGGCSRPMHRHTGQCLASAPGGELHGNGGAVVKFQHTQPWKGLKNPPARNATPAAPIEDTVCGSGRRPAELLQVRQHGIPFPADALPKGGVVLGKVLVARPIRATGGLAFEKRGPEAVEDVPVEILEVHGVEAAIGRTEAGASGSAAMRGMRRSWARRWELTP